MFHVKPNATYPINKGRILVFVISVFFISCIARKATIQIEDFLLVPNGKVILGNSNPLTAFIFENNTKNMSIEKFLSMKFKTENYYSQEYSVIIDRNRYKIILYDNSEFEKYFDSSNYSVINLQPDDATVETQRKFIAFSMVSSDNQDCLSDDSLLKNIAVNYLKNLKDEYYNK